MTDTRGGLLWQAAEGAVKMTAQPEAVVAVTPAGEVALRILHPHLPGT